MVVVPALPEREYRHPEAISGTVGCGKAPPSPHMGRGIDQPGGVEANDGTKEGAPKQIPPSPTVSTTAPRTVMGIQLPTAYPGMESVFAKFRHVRQKVVRIVVHGLSGEDPAHMRPEKARHEENAGRPLDPCSGDASDVWPPRRSGRLPALVCRRSSSNTRSIWESYIHDV
jgi:hypothetical protein